MRSSVFLRVFWLVVHAFLGLSFTDKVAAQAAATGFEALAAIPEGVESHGVVKPSFSDGVLSSLIKAATVVKVSEDRLNMSDMTLSLKGKIAAEDVNVELISASYHLPTRVLTSEEHTVVRRSDFVIEGDSLIYDTAKSVGQMTGNVTMIIDLPKRPGAGSNPQAPDKR